MVVFGREADDVKAAGTQRSCMEGTVAVSWGDDRPPHNATVVCMRRRMARVECRPWVSLVTPRIRVVRRALSRVGTWHRLRDGGPGGSLVTPRIRVVRRLLSRVGTWHRLRDGGLA